MNPPSLQLLLALACLSPALAWAQPVSFDSAPAGQTPPGWTAAITGQGQPRWTVEPDASAPSKPAVLKQSGQTPRPSYPLCIQDSPLLKDGFAEVKFKTLSGQTDQAAGLLWRFADTNNYYVCRANALENNVVLYKVQNGKRSALEITGRKGGYGVDTPVAPLAWHTLRVQFAGNTFTVFFNGKQLFQVQDDTFQAPGKLGLWTKADSVTLFDDFVCGSKQASQPAP